MTLKDGLRKTWGDYFKARLPHPLASVPFIGAQFQTPNIGIAGSGQTPNVGSSVSMRHITTPGKWDETTLVIPLGESGDPKSPHYKDQFDAWRTGNIEPFPFTEEAINKAARQTLTLVPE